MRSLIVRNKKIVNIIVGSTQDSIPAVGTLAEANVGDSIDKGKLIKATHRVTSYTQKRERHYPPIQEQLDALYWAMHTGEIPKAKKFFDSISLVKNTYPKQPT